LDWKRIKAEYIAGGTSYRKLAEKYGVSFNTLKTRAKEEQWYNLRQQKEHKTTTKIVESLSDKDAETAVDIIDVADKLLGKISMLMDAIPLDTQSMKHLTSALKDLKDIKGFKTDADMREQEARIRNLEKQAQTEDASKDILVKIGTDAEEYCG
jgi:transposase-like protein